MIKAFQIESIGVCHPDFFQGRGTAFSRWESVQVGIGNNEKEAASDALESLCQGEGEGMSQDLIEAIESQIEKLSQEVPEELSESLGNEVDAELYYYVAIYVGGDHIEVA